MRTDLSRLVGWAIPLICIAFAAIVLIKQRAAVTAASDHLTTAQRNEAAAMDAKDKAEKESGKMHFAAAPASDREESDFLNGLRMRAATAGIKITNWQSRGLDMPKTPDSSSSDEKKPDTATQGILKYSGNLTLNGPYQGIRSFIAALGQSNRLFTLTDMHWARKDRAAAGGTVELVTSISRYVDSTVAKPASVPTPEKKQ
jgi:hypothetical protein